MVMVAKKDFVIVYDGPRDTDFETDPSADLARVTFDSRLDYIGFKQVRQTFTVPAVTGSFFNMERVNLVEHQKGFTPITFAILRGWPNGDATPVDLPLGGGVLLDFYGQRPGNSGTLTYQAAANHTDRWSGNFARITSFDSSWAQKSLLVGAGANETHLFLWYEQAVRDVGVDANYPAFDMTIDFYVGDRSDDGVTGDAAPSNQFRNNKNATIIKGTRLTTGGSTDGIFDTANRYFHRDDVTPELPVPVSNASLFDSGGTFPNTYQRFMLDYGPNWRFDITQRVQGTPTIPTAQIPSRVGLSF